MLVDGSRHGLEHLDNLVLLLRLHRVGDWLHAPGHNLVGTSTFGIRSEGLWLSLGKLNGHLQRGSLGLNLDWLAELVDIGDSEGLCYSLDF